jgi:hypothetical protein
MEAHKFDTISRHFTIGTDSSNLDTLRKFIKTFGFIADTEISSACHFEILLLHLLRSHDPFLDSCVKANCLKGIIYPDIYCFYKDQEAASKKETVYGTFNGSEETYPIKDPQQTDRLRKEIGYPTLYESFLRNPNRKLPDNYKPDPELVKLYAPILKEK